MWVPPVFHIPNVCRLCDSTGIWPHDLDVSTIASRLRWYIVLRRRQSCSARDDAVESVINHWQVC